MSRFNYYRGVSVTTTSFPATPQVNFGFNSQGFSFLNRGSEIIEYSFDGTTVHGDLNPADATIGFVWDDRVENKVFFRTASGTSSVRVEAWGWGGR